MPYQARGSFVSVAVLVSFGSILTLAYVVLAPFLALRALIEAARARSVMAVYQQNLACELRLTDRALSFGRGHFASSERVVVEREQIASVRSTFIDMGGSYANANEGAFLIELNLRDGDRLTLGVTDSYATMLGPLLHGAGFIRRSRTVRVLDGWGQFLLIVANALWFCAAAGTWLLRR